ncbi:MAG: uracil phosphoribosyltransferase [Verrucomicrobia bacterium]|nr:uracil phosphoribosyltransferase [Verrucomicrobiota bacterium]
MPIHLIDHPLAKVLITQLRDKETPSESFRTACRKITQLLFIEATRSLPTNPYKVSTPLEETEANIWAKEMTIIPVIRAGIGMVESILSFFPNATVGYVGLERDEETAIARNYYRKVPSLKGRKAFIVDPMLATGGSTLQAIEICLEEGTQDITVVTIISAPEGVEAIENNYPDIDIYTAALDRQLNEQKFILPGLGDFGDRLYNT